MKKWFSQLPIRYKLHAIVLLCCTLALLLVMLASFGSQWYLVRKQIADEVQTLAMVLAENCSAGIAFEDRPALETILQSLAAKPNVMVGRIFNAKGELYAEYTNKQLISAGHEGINRRPASVWGSFVFMGNMRRFSNRSPWTRKR